MPEKPKPARVLSERVIGTDRLTLIQLGKYEIGVCVNGSLALTGEALFDYLCELFVLSHLKGYCGNVTELVLSLARVVLQRDCEIQNAHDLLNSLGEDVDDGG
jgi:hypothetical protein